MHDLMAMQAVSPVADARTADNLQAIVQAGLVESRESFRKSVAGMQGGAKIFAEVVETSWGSMKLLSDEIIRNVTSNVEAVFSAGEAIAKAKSPSEVAVLQIEVLQRLFGQTSEQMHEFIDLSARATQHVFETMQAATSRSMDR